MGSSTRRRHSPVFKLEAVRVLHERLAAGLALQRVSEEHDVGPDLLRCWAKQVERAPVGVSGSPLERRCDLGEHRRDDSPRLLEHRLRIGNAPQPAAEMVDVVQENVEADHVTDEQ